MIRKEELTLANRVVTVFSKDHYRWHIHHLPRAGWVVAMVRGGHGVKRVEQTRFASCAAARAWVAGQVAAHNARVDRWWDPEPPPADAPWTR